VSEGNESVESVAARLKEALSRALPPGEMRRVRRAVAVARRAHEGQSRDDGAPYLVHPLRTALILVEELGVAEPDALCAAILHDVLEDDKALTADTLRDEFGPRVAEMVTTLTKPTKAEGSREAVNREYFPRVARAGLATRLVKLADRLDNTRDLARCPDPAKRHRKLDETRSFYLAMVEQLEDAAARDALSEAFAEAIAQLRH
jgi:GTP pyrophosphokinase